jgi:predicted metal-binding membrane protein
VRLLATRHPEWWLYVVTAAAWFVLLAWRGGPETLPTHAVTGHHTTGVTTGQADGGDFARHLGHGLNHWLLMVLAMMLPLAAPQARIVALRSLWPRRHRSAVFFVAGYVALWLAVGLGILVPLAALEVTSAPMWVTPALLVLAALWHVAPQRRRLVRRCGSLRLRDADGLAADRNCTTLGLRAGALCVFSCGVVMLTMALQLGTGTEVLLMAGLLTVLLHERADGPDPAERAGHAREALALIAIAGLLSLPSVPG